jgi:broad specificity phosphatase PhoE
MLIFLRHGQTVYNTEHRYQGVADSLLTANGREQAKAMGTYVKNYQPTRYYLSPLPRVYETFSYIKEIAPAEYEIVPLLSEICYGRWEGKTKDEASKDVVWSQREQDRFHFVHPGSYNGKKGESYKQLYDRLVPFFEKLATLDETKNYAVIAHQGVMVAVKKYYESLSDTEAAQIRVPNNTILRIDMRNGSYTVNEVVI